MPGLTLRAAMAMAAMAATAGAQPVTHPDRAEPCTVTIVVAPPEVRAEIEDWVRAEPRCTRQLEVRVVPTDDGLYLTTRDQDGRVRERVVPDAQSAAVLVVSWMADDSLGPSYPDASSAPGMTQAPPGLSPRLRADGADDESPFAPAGLGAGHTRYHDTGRRFLSIGAIGTSSEHHGIRGEIDLLRGAHLLGGVRWLVGFSGGWRDDGGQARLIVGATYSIGRVSLRAHLGIGADYIAANHDRDDMMMTSSPLMDGDREHDVISPRIEAGLLARVAIDHNWAVLGGPIADAPLDEGRPALELFVGVQHGL